MSISGVSVSLWYHFMKHSCHIKCVYDGFNVSVVSFCKSLRLFLVGFIL